MKKVILTIAVSVMILLAGKTYAQITFHAGWQDAMYKAKASYNYYDEEGFNRTQTVENEVSLTGFYAGATYDIDLGMTSIFVTPGAELSYCTYKEDDEDLNQLDLRLRLWGRWNKSLTEEMVFGVFVGPSLNIGLSGNVYEEDDGDLKRFDLGLTFGAQLRYNRIGVEAGYNLGLLNRFKNSSEYEGLDGSIKFHTVFVGLNFII